MMGNLEYNTTIIVYNTKGGISMENITIFDKILAKKISADIVYEDDYVLSFKDVNPQAPIHVLVIPKKKISSISYADSLSAEYMGHFMHGIAKTARILKLEENGYRVIMNNGKDALQTVEYLHAHIVGGKKMSWSPA